MSWPSVEELREVGPPVGSCLFAVLHRGTPLGRADALAGVEDFTGLGEFMARVNFEELCGLSTGEVPELPVASGTVAKADLPAMTARLAKKQKARFQETGGVRKVVSIAQIKGVQHLTLEKAAEEMGMGTTQLKLQCRKLGIPRWAYRRL